LIRPEKMRLGLVYVEHHSLRDDLAILFETLRVILFPTAESKLPERIARELRIYECTQSQHR
jgi:hypothetical protein